jgi:hypothetical protein
MDEKELEQFMAGMMQGLNGAIPSQLALSEPTAWDNYVIAAIKTDYATEDAVAMADRLLVERRARFSANQLRERVMASVPDKAELRSIR